VGANPNLCPALIPCHHSNGALGIHYPVTLPKGHRPLLNGGAHGGRDRFQNTLDALVAAATAEVRANLSCGLQRASRGV